MPLDDEQLESRLRRWRPIGPPAGLRQRVLASASRQATRGARWVAASWVAAAVVVLATIMLQRAILAVERDIRSTVGGTRAVWTAEAEAMARALDGAGAGRRYMALMLAARPRQTVTAWPPLSTGQGHMP